MELNQRLYSDLYQLRLRIKERERYIQGRAPIVCTDDALIEITRLLPQKLSDFQCVPGLGQTFIDNYGEAFLKVILAHLQSSSKKVVKMNSEASSTLKELEKKLVNINRRNRLLYMTKTAGKYAYDLFDLDQKYDPLKILFGSSRGQIICNIKDISSSKGQSGVDKYRRIVQLIREVNKDLRDKGQYDLYIGYPFVQGRLLGENFDIRAPLALFPVTVERDAQSIKLFLDDTRDIVFNNTLVLAHYKFNNLSRPLPNNVVEDISQATFIQMALGYYKENGIELINNNEPLSRFIEYNTSEFPHYDAGELHLIENIVLGKFPTYSSSIQKDFNEIIDKNEINSLLNDLIVGTDEIDYYSDKYNGETEQKTKDMLLDITEESLVYINELNSAQEAVLSATEKMDELVVQGPPGTGKSQTITSLITEFVNEGKTVLMVSEKKTALDVVYSRLGNLSRYALMIDDVGNKDLFYKQLEQIIHPSSFWASSIDLKPLGEKIDSLILQLEHIAKKLYSPDTFGIEPYKLYLMNRRIDLYDPEKLIKYETIRKYINNTLLCLNFSSLDKIHQILSDELLLNNLEQYKKYIDTSPWMINFKENLTDYEVISFINNLNILSSNIQEWRAYNFLKRIFTKGKLKKLILDIANKYFLNFNKQTKLLLFDKHEDVKKSLSSYNEFIKKKPLYFRLSADEKQYFESLYGVFTSGLGNSSLCNDELFNQIIYEHIQQFESNNKELFENVSSFDKIILALSQCIAQKRDLTKKRLEQILKENLGHITSSKRSGDISRAVESRRKWSINKFIKKFDFELFKGVKIWLMTPEVVSELLPLQVGLFDLVIFDEASQMFVEKGIPSIIRAKKVVIAGDHKQLRPSNLGVGRLEIDEDLIEEDAEISAALEEESLLDLARFKYNDVLLNFHYRSKYEELIAFSNYAFYKGRLYVSPNVEKPEKPPIEVLMVDNALWVNRSNIQEAREVVRLLKQFFESRKNNDTIGIITFNSSQRDLIEDLLDEECTKDQTFSVILKAEIERKLNGEDIGFFVKNIESVQGDERDVIMFSIGYAKNENGRLVRNYGWLNQKGGENRLNVAITRAKKKIYLVTSFDPSELQVEDAKNDGPRILKKYLEYAFAISNCNQEVAKQILLSFGDNDVSNGNVSFDSDFENQVFDALVDQGYQVETQVGIGGYSIDLAIKRDGKYILGIECDGKLYHSSKSARERDYHRQKYLESRGWRIHRIWSTNWWRNSKAEIAKICTVVDSL